MRREGFGRLMGYKDALELLFSKVAPFERSERVGLSDALMRVLAEDVRSPIDVPHFVRAAMDGYAVRAEDTYGASYENPVRLRCIGSLTPGDVPDKEVSKGLCVRISTGSVLPNGADAVVMIEDTETEGETVVCYRALAPQTNIIPAGSDFKRGSIVVEGRTLLLPRHLGALAATGCSAVDVLERPKIAVLSTGPEIVGLGEPLSVGKVYNINTVTLSSALCQFGCEPLDFGIVEDEKTAVEWTLKEALKDADVVLISGGSSLGEGDVVPEILQDLGELLFHGIAVKPGKPTSAAVLDGKLVLGLPGYPTSALSNFYILVLPLIEKMLGVRFERRRLPAIMGRKVASATGRFEFLPVKVEDGKAYPLRRGSSAISSLSDADGFVEIEENVEVLPAGGEVNVWLF